MFLFTLAQDLHKTIGELKDMTSEEFAYWMAFYDYKNKEIRRAQKNGR